MSKLERLLAPSLLLCSFSLPLALHAQRIPVDRSLLRANDVRILSRTGIRTLPRSIQVAQLSPGEYLIARVGAPPRCQGPWGSWPDCVGPSAISGIRGRGWTC